MTPPPTTTPRSVHALIEDLRQLYGHLHIWNAGDLAVRCRLCRTTTHRQDVLAYQGAGYRFYTCVPCGEDLLTGDAP